MEPQFSLDPYAKRKTASRTFTDRFEPTNAFKAQLNVKLQHPERQIVTVFYGVGGIGKTRLREELARYLDDQNQIPWALVDFQTPQYRDQAAALIRLSSDLHSKYKIKFKTFSLVYSLYWKKAQPHLSLRENKALAALFENGDMVSDIINIIESVPAVGLIAKTLNFGTKVWNTYLKEWWISRGNYLVEQLENKEPHQIENYLPWAFAQDIKEAIADSPKNIVIFLDTYESLWKQERDIGTFYERDRWVRELISQLPEAYWIILGRDYINWNEVKDGWDLILDQHLLSDLSGEDVRAFLTSCDITDDEIQNRIVDLSKGVPFYLDVAVDIYERINKSRKPTISDFPKTEESIQERFLRYLNTSEKETLKLLSLPKFWDEELFKFLVTEFHTQFPVSTYHNLLRFSFIERGKFPDTYQMHALMRECLLEEIRNSEPLCSDANVALFNYFRNRLNELNTPYDLALLDEAMRFGSLTKSKTFSIWEHPSFHWNAGDSGLIGREQEINQVTQMFREHSENISRHNVVFISGAAGLGKTALLYHLRDIFQSRGFRCTYIDARGHNTKQSIVRAVVSNLGILNPDSYEDESIMVSGTFASQMQASNLSGQPFVIFVDDIDILNNEVYFFINELMSAVPEFFWIVSSRSNQYNLPSALRTTYLSLSPLSADAIRKSIVNIGLLGGGFLLDRLVMAAH